MVFLKKISIFMVALTQCGCLATYLVKSGYNQFDLLDKRESIDDVLKRKDLTPEQKSKLQLTLKVRKFAIEKLKLKPTENYTTFVDIHRPYVTYIVTVAKKYELEPELYWYPIVGSLPYKGFFKKSDADDEAKKWDPTLYDVMVRGVSAYSTLGWFEDPLLSSMITGEDHHLVNLILHESTHATLYIKSQADFNEQLATYVGNLGTELYYKEIEGEKSKTLVAIKNENGDEKLFSEFMSRETRELKKWYQQKKDNHEKIDEAVREAQFDDIKKHFASQIAPKLKSDSYQNFQKIKLNNAVLLYFNTYVFDLSDFAKRYEQLGHDFEKFLTFCKSLEKNSNPRQALTLSLPSSSNASAGP